MPRQEFRLSYLIYPNDYTKEVLGVSVPLTFLNIDREAYLFRYSPVSFYDVLTMEDVRLGDRQELHQDASVYTHALGVREYTQDALVATGLNADKQGKESGLLFTQSYAEWVKFYEAITIKDIRLVETFTMREGHKEEVRALADRNNRYKEASIIADRMLSKIRKQYRDGTKIIGPILVDRNEQMKEVAFNLFSVMAHRNYKDSGLTREVEMGDRHPRLELEVYEPTMFGDSVYRDSKVIDYLTYADERRRRELDIVHTIIYGGKIIRDSKLVQEMVETVRKHYDGRLDYSTIFSDRELVGSGKIIDNVIFMTNDGKTARYPTADKDSTSFADKDTSEAFIQKVEPMFEKFGYSSRVVTKFIYSLVDGKNSRLKEETIFAHWNGGTFEASFQDDLIQAEYGTAEAFIYKAVQVFEKHGITAAIVKAITADGKYNKLSATIDGMRASSTKREHDSDKALTVDASFEKDERDSYWLERLIYSVHAGRDSFIQELVTQGDKIDKDTIVALLEQAEIPDREGLLKEIELKLAWNKDKPNRPASILEVKSASWDIGWDDLTMVWDPGWDYLDTPNKDYPYEDYKATAYNPLTGIPLNPLGPTNKADVEIDRPVNHPIPDWADIGKNETWVDLFIFQDVVMQIAILQRTEKAKFAGMTGQEALQFIMKAVHEELTTNTPWTDDYQRVFRFVRWYAERIIHMDSVTILHRTYKDWVDGIAGTGVMDAYNVRNNMDMSPTGLIESTSSFGEFEFEKTGYIDGQITFSQVISSVDTANSSWLEFYIDNVRVHTHYVSDGIQRLSFDVPAGHHTYRFRYQVRVGDIVKLSGFNISGVKFVEATTSQKDVGDLRGLTAISHLIQALLTYYHKHHKGKVKGAMTLNQRKIWLT